MARPNVVKLVGVDSKNGEIIAVYISHELSGYKGKFVPDRPHVEWKTESAIDYLTEIGWLPEHDRILTERPQGKWEYLKEHIAELRDANGYATQYGTCQFILNLMSVIEREGEQNV